PADHPVVATLVRIGDADAADPFGQHPAGAWHPCQGSDEGVTQQAPHLGVAEHHLVERVSHPQHAFTDRMALGLVAVQQPARRCSPGTGSRSGACSRSRSHTSARNQPSPNGTSKATPFSLVIPVNVSSGARVSCTSASRMCVAYCLPTKSTPT